MGNTDAMTVVAILMSVGAILLWWVRKRAWRHGHGWYRSSLEGPNARAHYFQYGGDYVPRILFAWYYSLCRRKYLHSSCERIEDTSPDIMCSKCMDFIRRKKN